jgi:hypothetical protein
LDLRFFPNHVQHAIFQCLFIFAEPVLLPSVVKNLSIKAVSLHALVK